MKLLSKLTLLSCLSCKFCFFFKNTCSVVHGLIHVLDTCRMLWMLEMEVLSKVVEMIYDFKVRWANSIQEPDRYSMRSAPVEKTEVCFYCMLWKATHFASTSSILLKKLRKMQSTVVPLTSRNPSGGYKAHNTTMTMCSETIHFQWKKYLTKMYM